MIEKLNKYLKDNQLVKKSLITLIIRGLGVVLSFGIALYITNNFDSSGVGKYEISRQVLNIFGSLALLGLNEAIIYYSGVFHAKKSISSIKKLYKQMISIIAIVAVLLFLVYIFGLKFILLNIYDEDTQVIIYKTFIILGFHGITMLNIDFYRAINRIEASELFRNIFRTIFFFFGLIILVYFDKKELLVDAFLLNYIFIGIVSTILVIKSFQKIPFQENQVGFSKKEIVKRSFPMTISAVAFLLLQSTDILILKKYVSFSEVAYYGIAAQITKIIALVLYSVNAVFANKIAELFELQNFAELKKTIKQSTRLIFIMTTPVTLVMLIFSDFFLGLFGAEYVAAQPALNILLIGQIFNCGTGTVGMYMNMTGEQNKLQIILVIALVANLILNILLIPKFGLVGAAYSTAGTTIAWNIYCALYLYFKKGIKTFIH